jgi:hypothetical protein
LSAGLLNKMIYPITPAAAGVIRDSHYAFSNQTQGFEKCVLLEGGSTNLALGSNLFGDGTYWQNPNHFVLTPAPSIVAGQTATRHLNNGDSSGLNFRAQTVGTFVNGQTDTFYVIVENDPTMPATTMRMGIYDTSGGGGPVNSIDFNWATHVTTNASGGGLHGAVQLDDTRWLVWANATGNPSGIGGGGNPREVFVYPSGSFVNGQAAILHHAQLEPNQSLPTSPIITVGTPKNRNPDSLTFPATPTLPLTLYIRFINLGTTEVGAFNGHIIGLGRGASIANTFLIISGGLGEIAARFYNHATTTTTEQSGRIATFNDVVEIRATLDTTGIPTLGISINGDAETVSTVSGITPDPTWTQNILTLTVNGDGTSNAGFHGLTHVHIEQGIQTMDYMRAKARA